MLTHLYAAYAKINEGHIEENNKHMRAGYDVNQVMDILI